MPWPTTQTLCRPRGRPDGQLLLPVPDDALQVQSSYDVEIKFDHRVDIQIVASPAGDHASHCGSSADLQSAVSQVCTCAASGKSPALDRNRRYGRLPSALPVTAPI